MTLRVINRAIVLDARDERILLVRNKDASFWYAPGGEWEHQREPLEVGGTREVLEEVGIPIKILRLFYVRTFQPTQEAMQLELFWLARPLSVRIPTGHTDQHGLVEEARWLRRSELKNVQIFPLRLKTRFWIDIKNNRHNPYINE